MVLDITDEVSGYVRDEKDEARLLLETQRQGYFTNDMLLRQVEWTMDIFEWVHPQAKALMLLIMLPPIASMLMIYQMVTA